jgi:hypothetical protein
LADPARPRRSRRSGATSPARDSCRRRTRRASRLLQHAGVVVVARALGRLAHERREIREQPAIERCVIAPRGSRARARTSTR